MQYCDPPLDGTLVRQEDIYDFEIALISVYRSTKIKKRKFMFEQPEQKKADRDFTLYLPKNQKMYLSNSSKKQNSPNNLFTEKKFKLLSLGSPLPDLNRNDTRTAFAYNLQSKLPLFLASLGEGALA